MGTPSPIPRKMRSASAYPRRMRRVMANVGSIVPSRINSSKGFLNFIMLAWPVLRFGGLVT